MIAPDAALAPNLVSLTRPVLGVLLAGSLQSGSSPAALPLVLAACLSDYVDGRLARRAGLERFSGRLIDNFCDATFLALAFWAMGEARLWAPAGGWLGSRWVWVNGLPLLAFASAFTAYLARMLIERLRGIAPARSRLGHAAGIANYGLAIAGAVEAIPSLTLWPGFREPGFVAIAALNLAAVAENLGLVFPARRNEPTMRP
ncbi:MAG TPA: CDP-alcohol phosphatidyltransferase family protein [Candidatus Binatia bacterium]|nr:CDP-alcohol phosphatidyltransferase family protein [Candidatus Binatia bacterium]